MAYVRNDTPLGQLDAAVAASATPASPLLPFYLVAVAAGVSVWFLTKLLEGRRRRR